MSFKLLKLFTSSYWRRRKYVLAKWKARRTSIKYLFNNKLAVKEPIMPQEKPISYNELMKTLYEKPNSNIDDTVVNSTNIMSERICNSYEHIH